MEKIDLKDKKILYQLTKDSRQSIRQIGKKVGLPKSVVNYRIKKLQEKNIIKNYITLIDLTKLEYTTLRFYLKFHYASPEIKKEIVDYFKKSKYAGIVHTIEGDFDLAIYFYTKNLKDFYTYWQETLNKYKKYFSEQILSYYIEEDIYNYSFLNDKKHEGKKFLTLFEGKKKEKIDDLDYKILKIISSNARKTSSEIALKLNTSAVTISKRIKKMQKNNVIKGFKTNIDFPKIGFRWHKIDINLRDHTQLKSIIHYVSRNPYFVRLDKTLGYKDLELEFYLKDTQHLHQIIDDLTRNFPDSIKEYSITRVLKTHKYKYLPGK